ncbi:MAG: chemotaxis protein CheW, partial [Armatimonadetes bacterium]|nr:chemotaxis protein CheW [Armatimonadota bacterium]
TGILVEEVREVRVLPAGSIEAAPAYNGGGGAAEARFIRGVATVDEDIVALLDLDALVKAVGRTPALPAEGEIAVAPVRHGFSPGASPEEREIFRSRAQQLRQTTESFDIVGLLPVAVVSLGGEYYGLDLELIREFTRVGEITPVPCCPAHIVGNLNLRGEVLTLIDIRGVLSVPTEGVPACECAVVVEVDDLSVGVLVDEVFDVAYLRPGEITAVPTALKAAGDEYLTGTARRGDRTLGILDLRALLGREDLIVDEEV